MAMRKITLLLDTSILKSLLIKNSLYDATIKLLALCSGKQQQFEAFYTVVSIHEIYQEYDLAELQALIATLNAYQVQLILHEFPKEVDYFAINAKNKEKLGITNEYDLYNLAMYGVTNIEEYITWNQVGLIKQRINEYLLTNYVASGYHATKFFSIHDPYFLLAHEAPNYVLDDIVNNNLHQRIPIEEELYSYIALQNWFKQELASTIAPKIEKAPSRKIRAKRTPKKDINLDNGIQISLKNYKPAINEQKLPLLHFGAKAVGFDMEYELFEVTFTAGQAIIEEMLLDILLHRPLKEETELSKEAFKQRKTQQLFEQILPLIRQEIGATKHDFPNLQKEEWLEFPIKNLDTELTNSFSNLYINSFYEIKKEAIALVEQFFTKDLLQYRGFKTYSKWTELHDYGAGAVDMRSSIFAIEKTGKRMVVVLQHCYID